MTKYRSRIATLYFNTEELLTKEEIMAQFYEVPECDCHNHHHQVCDICQKVTGQEKDKVAEIELLLILGKSMLGVDGIIVKTFEDKINELVAWSHQVNQLLKEKQ